MLTDVQKQLRRKLITVAYNKQVSHIGSCLSCIDILYDIYNNNEHDKIRVVLSKGHAALALYVVLNHFGYITDELLGTYCDDGSELYGHVSLNRKLRVDCTAGSLGHGPSIAAGYALAEPEKIVYCICGDGETQEGSYKEAIDFVQRQRLNNFKLIVDVNGFQGYEKTFPLYAGNLVNKYKFLYTKKGGGVSFLENSGLKSHYQKLTKEQYEKAMCELT